jgi:hypothetical protein
VSIRPDVIAVNATDLPDPIVPTMMPFIFQP